MLANLVAYARQQGIEAEEGFTPNKTVRWLILFNQKGKFIDIHDLKDADDKRSRGRSFDKTPHLKFAGDTPMRQFLVDTAKYALLFGEDKPDKKLLIKHEFFLNLLREAASADRVFGMIADALSDEDVRKQICETLADPDKKAKSPDNVTFGIFSKDGLPRILVEEDVWHDWWRGHFPTLFNRKTDGDEASMLCLVTGEETQPARTHPKVKGLGGVGGRVDTTLISFNEDAFCSYGLEQSCNAAISQDAAQQYVAALNTLIEHGETMAGTKVLYWYVGDKKIPPDIPPDIPPEDDPLQLLLHGCDFGEAEVVEDEDEQASLSPRDVAQLTNQAKKMLTAIHSGQRPDLANARYNALTISGNSARVVIRDWMEGQFEELVENIAAWISDLAIGSLTQNRLINTLGIETIFYSLLPERKHGQSYDSWIASLSPYRHSLYNVAVVGKNYSIPKALAERACHAQRQTVLTKEFPEISVVAINRIREDNPESRRTSLYSRMAIMKAYCVRYARTQQKENYNVTAFLNENHPRSSYHCGRLMAVLQMIQRKAQGEIGVTIAQSHYASASTRPITSLPRLQTLTQHHLPKIKDRLLRLEYQRLLSQIQGCIEDTIPRTFDLEDQCLFHLGYYQQLPYAPYEELSHRHITIRGEGVRSKSEVIVANILHFLDLDYKYEEELKPSEDNEDRNYTIHPDFTVHIKGKKPIYIEHLGMMDNFTYRKDWKKRKENYTKEGILPFEDGGGENGSLITTEEDKGAIDCPKLIETLKSLTA